MRIQSAAIVFSVSVLLTAAGCGGGGTGSEGQAGGGGGSLGGSSGAGGKATGGAGGGAAAGSSGTGATGGSAAGSNGAGGSAGGGIAGANGTGGAAAGASGTGGAAAGASGTGGAAAGASGTGGAAGSNGSGGAAAGGQGGGSVDPCTVTPGPCGANATCTSTGTGAVCACGAGFFGNGQVCTACATCAAGRYQTAACTATQDTACSTCAVCGGGEYQTAACGPTSNATCSACAADCLTCSGIGACTVCAPGFYASSGICVACATCIAGDYQAAACTTTADAVCVGCSTCDAGTYQTATCGATSDTTCATCSTCGAGTYETGACGGTSDRLCASCSSCGAGQYQTAACTPASNSACATCSTCGAGQYQSAACTATSNSACATCSSCGAGQYQTAACAATSDTACATCGNCPIGHYAVTACGSNSDTICGACDANCDACTAPGACTTCSAGYGPNGGACVPSGKSCLAIHRANPSAPSGVYQLDPDGGSSSDAFLAYCDMTNDGAGWMKILQYNNAAYTPTAAAVGNIAVPDTSAMAKLADTNVNSLSNLATYREYRFQGDLSTNKLFIESSAIWDDTAQGEGLVLTGTTLACEATTNCTYVTVTAPAGRPSIDSNDWTPSLIGSANNQDRYFTDYAATPNCYITGSTTQRCYDAGVTTGHALIPNLSIWVREAPVPTDAIIIYPLDEGSGTIVGDTSGNGDNATVVSGSWTTPGHTGSALLGALRTNGSVPVTTAVTVSAWVRRDGAGTAYPRILSWNNDGLELADANHANNLGVYTPSLGWQPTGVGFGTGFHHVAVTVGGGTVTVYFDGTQVYTAATTVSLTGQMSIGTRWNDVESWVGAVDQVRVYSRVLSSGEIVALANE